MTKARRGIEDKLKLVDAVCEIVDARIPRASQNPDMDIIAPGKPRLIVLSRPDLADVQMNKLWVDNYRARGFAAITINANTGEGVQSFVPSVRALLAEKLKRLQEKGQTGKALRVMILGIPNVGKSSLINKLTGRKSAVVADWPGVTRGQQWYHIANGLDLLDTPGVLWPKFEDEETGHLLAFTGAIRDDILDTEELASLLLERLSSLVPDALRARYKISAEDVEPPIGFHLLEAAARKRGFLLSGGVPDTERMSHTVLDEFRGGKLGRITLERPDVAVSAAEPANPRQEDAT